MAPREPAAARFRELAREATLVQAAVLRIVGAVQATNVVVGRRLVEPRRGRPVRATGAGARLVLAGWRGLQEGELKRSFSLLPFLGLRGERRNPAVGRVHNQRRPPARSPHRLKHRVVRTADIRLGPRLRTRVASRICRPLPVERGDFLLGEKLPARVLRRANLEVVGPDAPAGPARPKGSWEQSEPGLELEQTRNPQPPRPSPPCRED